MALEPINTNDYILKMRIRFDHENFSLVIHSKEQ